MGEGWDCDRLLGEKSIWVKSRVSVLVLLGFSFAGGFEPLLIGNVLLEFNQK